MGGGGGGRRRKQLCTLTMPRCRPLSRARRTEWPNMTAVGLPCLASPPSFPHVHCPGHCPPEVCPPRSTLSASTSSLCSPPSPPSLPPPPSPPSLPHSLPLPTLRPFNSPFPTSCSTPHRVTHFRIPLDVTGLSSASCHAFLVCSS